jgi:phosphatidylglycerol lysyltransferase
VRLFSIFRIRGEQMYVSNHSSTAFDYTQGKSQVRVLLDNVHVLRKPEEKRRFNFTERVRYLRKYGNHCMSYSALQPGMHYFDIAGKGYIAYMEKWGARFALADPVCDEKDYEELIGEFIRENPNCGFAEVSEPVAKLIHDKFGFYGTQFGVESVVDLKSWDLKGKKKQVLRTSLNHAKKRGITVTEKHNDDGARELSEEWLKTRKVKTREILFLIRPMNMDHDLGTRKFFAYQGDNLIGFIYFDPLFENDSLLGYVPNISRFSQSFRQGIFYTIMAHAMEVFKSEGVPEIHLGLSPLVTGEGDKHYESPIVKKIVRLLYEYGNKIYNFKGIYFTKSRFRGTDYPTYCCHKSIMPAKKFLTMFKIANVF